MTNTYYYIRMANGEDAADRAVTQRVKLVFPSMGEAGTHVNVSGGGVAKHAPNRANAVKFMNFLLDPKNAAAVTNYAAYNAGVTGAEKFLSESILKSPENNPPKGQKGEFIQACDQETQKLYDAIWTNLKK